MTALQVVALTFVLVAGTAVVLTQVPLKQTLVLAVYGFGLTALFFSFQAPDVALSEIVVGGVGLPVVILAALRKLADIDEEDGGAGDGGEGS
jgi:energy-converting hydrogenase B subunit D